MLCEVYRGYIGLGAAAVFRTAAQAASDIEMFGRDAGPLATQGGLLTQQAVFKYAASQGRLKDLQQEVEQISNRLDTLKVSLLAKATELESLGATNAAVAYTKMAAKAVISYALPFMSVFSFMGIDIFGGSSKKKKRIEALTIEADALVAQLRYWSGRAATLQAEGEALAKAVEGGERAVDVQLVALPRKTAAYLEVADPAKYGPDRVWRKTHDVVVPDTAYGHGILSTQEELTQRTAGKMAPSGDRLPVGFQTIYSPVLEHGKIVAKVPQLNTALPNPVDRRVVYGGLLSGDGMDPNTTFNLTISGALIVSILAYFLWPTKK